MFNETVRNALAPLLLRLALAAILIYHGVEKIRPPNDWGATWATTRWARQTQAPDDVLDKLGELKGLSDAKIESIQTQVRRMYNAEAGMAPESLRMSAAQLAVAWGELLGGVALLLGLLTRLAALGVLIIQVGAIVTVTAYHGFSAPRATGAEYNVALVAMCLALIVTGAGFCSIDHRRKSRQKAPAAQQQVPVTV
jgi:uncharacterized membrane protein YphA (DoxX/SURF4 family)